MDLTVELINLAHSLGDSCEGRLPRLHLLFMTLLNQDSSVVDQLPVGPDAACTALRELCDADDMPSGLRLELPDRIEEVLAKELDTLYLDLTEALTKAGVPPKSLLRSAQEGGSGTGGGLGAARNMAESAPLDSGMVGTPLSKLQNSVLHKRGAQSEGSGGGVIVSDPTLLKAILDQVTHWLTERQSEAARQPYGSESAQVNLGELSGLLPPSSNATLEALNLSFDALLLDKELPNAVKPSIGRLRLPVSKAALLDAKFLATDDHPARRLLDVVLRLAKSLEGDEAPQHPVCLAIEEAACRVQRNFVEDIAVFGDAALPLLAMEQSRNADATARAANLLPLAEREARREQARSRAARAIRALCAAEPPEPVRIFLERLWVRVLAHVHQVHGEKSQEWVRTLATGNQLIDSVQPKTDAEARRNLITLLPDLLSQLRAGLNSIATPEILRERAFHSFVALHSAALHGKVADLAMRQDVLPPAMPPRVDTVPELPGLSVVRLSPDSEPDNELPEWIAQLKLGDWLQLSLPDAGPKRLRIAWIGGMPRMLLLNHPDKDISVLLPLRWLISRAAERAAAPLPMDALFERAAERAMQQVQGYA